jgi:hypothetical protein
MLSSPLMGLLEAADGELRDEIVAALRGYGDNVLGCLMPALRSAAALPAATRAAAGLDVVARDCMQRLGAIIARPRRAQDDWSIGCSGCGCGLSGRKDARARPRHAGHGSQVSGLPDLEASTRSRKPSTASHSSFSGWRP